MDKLKYPYEKHLSRKSAKNFTFSGDNCIVGTFTI